MTFKQVLSFFLTGATVLSMSTAALAAEPAEQTASPPLAPKPSSSNSTRSPGQARKPRRR